MLKDIFIEGDYFPLSNHEPRIDKYKRNEKLAEGKHEDVFKQNQNKNDMYISVNFAGLITRKSADFLVGEPPEITAGKENNSKEQEALDRIIEDNGLYKLIYQQALQSAKLGDAFIKVRFGQEYNGAFPKSFDKPRTIIEGVDAKKVYPQTSPFDKSKIVAYHIAEPIQVKPDDDEYNLYVESHYAGEIHFRRFELRNFQTDVYGNIITFKIGKEMTDYYEVEKTGVPTPLVIHIPNFSDGTTWEGQDDLSEHIDLFDEINNRTSQVGSILDSHANPALAVPTGLLSEDGEGNPYFNVAMNKVFEVMGKEDIIPEYVTNNNPQLDQAFTQLDKLIEFLLAGAEIPNVAVGLQDSGTSGNSGLSIKWRMNGLLAKINRKRQFFEDSLKRVLVTAQMLEFYANPKGVDYELTRPQIKFNNGLPTDEAEQANIMAIRTNGSQTLSQKSALMALDGLTEDQATEELAKIEEEKEKAMEVEGVNAFNEVEGEELEVNKRDNRQTNSEDEEQEE